MNSEKIDSPDTSYFRDIVVLLVTIVTSSLLLTADGAFNRSTATIPIADITPVLALPTPPAPLDLPPEPLFKTLVGERFSALPTIVATVMEANIDSAPLQDEGRSTRSSESGAVSSTASIPFHGIIIQAAGRYEVDPHLIRAIILAESNYNPNALSKKGARGLMQLMPSTAKALGVQNIFDPEENIDGGVRYFRSLLDRFDGDVQLALAAYNAGSRHVRNYDGIPPFKATQHYIKKVLRFHKKFKTENVVESRRLA